PRHRGVRHRSGTALLSLQGAPLADWLSRVAAERARWHYLRAGGRNRPGGADLMREKMGTEWRSASSRWRRMTFRDIQIRPDDSDGAGDVHASARLPADPLERCLFPVDERLLRPEPSRHGALRIFVHERGVRLAVQGFPAGRRAGPLAMLRRQDWRDAQL